MEKLELDINETTGKVTHLGDPLLLLNEGVLVFVQKEIEKADEMLARRTMYSVGEEFTKESVSHAQKLFAKTVGRLMKKDMVFSMMKLGMERGWGVIKPGPFIDYDTGEGQIIVENSVIARNYGKSSAPVCYALAGILAGASEIIYGGNYFCEERACMAKGDPYCLFEFKKVSAEMKKVCMKSVAFLK